jgi:hypothetical protein
VVRGHGGGIEIVRTVDKGKSLRVARVMRKRW